MSQYTAPNLNGPTPDYAGDPNDYQPTGNGFDFDSISGGISSLLGPILGFAASMYATSQGQPQPQQGYPQGYPQQQQQPQSSMILYAGIAFFVLILLAVVALILNKK